MHCFIDIFFIFIAFSLPWQQGFSFDVSSPVSPLNLSIERFKYLQNTNICQKPEDFMMFENRFTQKAHVWICSRFFIWFSQILFFLFSKMGYTEYRISLEEVKRFQKILSQKIQIKLSCWYTPQLQISSTFFL